MVQFAKLTVHYVYFTFKRPFKHVVRVTIIYTTNTLINNTYSQRRRTVRTKKNISTVVRNIEDEPNESICLSIWQLKLCLDLRMILRRDFGLQANIIQLVQ